MRTRRGVESVGARLIRPREGIVQRVAKNPSTLSMPAYTPENSPSRSRQNDPDNDGLRGDIARI